MKGDREGIKERIINGREQVIDRKIEGGDLLATARPYGLRPNELVRIKKVMHLDLTPSWIP